MNHPSRIFSSSYCSAYNLGAKLVSHDFAIVLGDVFGGVHKWISQEKEPVLERSAEKARLPAAVAHSSVGAGLVG